jgi:RNA polymerase sigma-70 factor, ECF subfamily
VTEARLTSERDWLAGEFEEHRGHLRGVAYRMLGSLSDADDAVQEAWLRVSRAETGDVLNIRAWLTTVVARVSLNMLRSRTTRREELIDTDEFSRLVRSDTPEADQEAVLADSVGLALLVVLERLTPAERLAFVLHDMFDLSFEEIAPIVGRSTTAARQLASRGRRRVQGAAAAGDADLRRRREVVEAFLLASRDGDFGALVALLDPDVTLRIDNVLQVDARSDPLGVEALLERTRALSRVARFCRVVLLNGAPGLVMAPRGHLARAIMFSFSSDDKVASIEVIADPAHLRELDVSVSEPVVR